MKQKVKALFQAIEACDEKAVLQCLDQVIGKDGIRCVEELVNDENDFQTPLIIAARSIQNVCRTCDNSFPMFKLLLSRNAEYELPGVDSNYYTPEFRKMLIRFMLHQEPEYSTFQKIMQKITVFEK